MIKKSKYVLITIIAIIMFLTMFLGLSTQYAFAFSGVADIQSEKELYNATNTYNVNASCFNSNGDLNTVIDNDNRKWQHN